MSLQLQLTEYLLCPLHTPLHLYMKYVDVYIHTHTYVVFNASPPVSTTP